MCAAGVRVTTAWAAPGDWMTRTGRSCANLGHSAVSDTRGSDTGAPSRSGRGPGSASLRTVLREGILFQGRYRPLGFIASGAMGDVYEVLDERTQGRRALKLLRPEVVDDADKRARFALEATVTGGIESDHVVRVYDAGFDEALGVPFIAMELLRGEELGDMLKGRGALSAPEVVGYLWQAALALDKTHAAGIVHRDLKPANLFVSRRDDGSSCVKILDFGIAKVVAPDGKPQKTKVLGTPYYMAPEQMRGAVTIGPQTDVYALGHVAYALLAGEPYWKEEASGEGSVIALWMRILQGPAEPPSARAARRGGVPLPSDFDAWFARCTAVAVEQRFAQATTAVAALGHALGLGSPASSGPAPHSFGPLASGPHSSGPLASGPHSFGPPASAGGGPAVSQSQPQNLHATAPAPQPTWPVARPLPAGLPVAPQPAAALTRPGRGWFFAAMGLGAVAVAAIVVAVVLGTRGHAAGKATGGSASGVAPARVAPDGDPVGPGVPPARVAPGGDPVGPGVPQPPQPPRPPPRVKLYEDHFDDDRGRWRNPGGEFVVLVRGGRLAMSAQAASFGTWPTQASIGTPANVAIEVSVSFLLTSPGAFAGATFRMGDRYDAYSAGIDAEGTARLVRYDAQAAAWRPLVPDVKSPAIRVGRSPVENRLEVVARGGDIRLRVNGEMVLHAVDTALARGSVGLFLMKGASVLFDDYVVSLPE